VLRSNFFFKITLVKFLRSIFLQCNLNFFKVNFRVNFYVKFLRSIFLRSHFLNHAPCVDIGIENGRRITRTEVIIWWTSASEDVIFDAKTGEWDKSKSLSTKQITWPWTLHTQQLITWLKFYHFFCEIYKISNF